LVLFPKVLKDAAIFLDSDGSCNEEDEEKDVKDFEK
jgi:hypothetical protein